MLPTTTIQLENASSRHYRPPPVPLMPTRSTSARRLLTPRIGSCIIVRTGSLYYDVDGTGSQGKVLVASLLANLGLTNLDFEIV